MVGVVTMSIFLVLASAMRVGHGECANGGKESECGRRNYRRHCRG